MNAHLVVLCAVVALGSCTIGPAVNGLVGSVNGIGVLGNGIGLNRPILGVDPIGYPASIGLPLVNGYNAPLVNGGIVNVGLNGLAANAVNAAVHAAQTVNAINTASSISTANAINALNAPIAPMPLPVSGLINSPIIVGSGLMNGNGRSVVNVKKNIQVLPARW